MRLCSWIPRPSKQLSPSNLITAIVSFITVLTIYTAVVVNLTRHVNQLTLLSSSSVTNGLHHSTNDRTYDTDVSYQSRISYAEQHGGKRPFPTLFIYRRSMKTGSSSMRDALLNNLQPLGYHSIPYKRLDLHIVLHHHYLLQTLSSTSTNHIHNNNVSTLYDPMNAHTIDNAMKIVLVQHNDITKQMEPNGNAVIADTFRDGYAQMTSFCIDIQRISSCYDIDALQKCLLSNTSLQQRQYRYAGMTTESSHTYIDLPLSSSHPALSTTILRSIFPNVTLQLDIHNAHNSTCPEDTRIRAIYNAHYGDLDKQVETLQRRMLLMTGYPTKLFHPDGRNGKKTRYDTNDDLWNLLDAAEELERQKLGVFQNGPQLVDQVSNDTLMFRRTLKQWFLDRNGHLRAGTKSEIAQSRLNADSHRRP